MAWRPARFSTLQVHLGDAVRAPHGLALGEHSGRALGHGEARGLIFIHRLQELAEGIDAVPGCRLSRRSYPHAARVLPCPLVSADVFSMVLWKWAVSLTFALTSADPHYLIENAESGP